MIIKVSSIQSRQNERYSEFLGSNYKGKKRVQAWDEFGPQLWILRARFAIYQGFFTMLLIGALPLIVGFTGDTEIPAGF